MAISGAGSKVTGFSCVRRWIVAPKGAPAKGYCSDSDSGPIIIPAGMDWGGLVAGYGTFPPYLPGATFQLVAANRLNLGYQSEENGAIVDRVLMRWDSQRPELINYVLWFSAATEAITAGSYTPSSGAVPNPPNPVGLGLKLDGAEQVGIFQMQLDIRNLTIPYRDSSTGANTARTAGNYKANFQYLQHITDPSTQLLARDAPKIMLFETTDAWAGYWEMRYGLVTEIEVEADVEGGGDGQGKLHQATVSGEWTGWKTGSKGTIITPSGTIWWP